MNASDREITDCFSELEEAVGEMNAWWMASLSTCDIYKLPILTDVGVPQRLPVEPVNGKLAAKEAANAFAQFGYYEEQDSRTAFRLPGLIFVSSQDRSVVVKVNDLKTQLQKFIVGAYPEANKRLRYCRGAFPKISMGQVYRHIVLPEEGLTSVGFTWSPATVGSTRLTVKQARLLLDENIEQEDAQGNSDRVSALTRARSNVGKLASSVSVIKRKPVPPHPRANLVYQNGPSKMVHANLPFIISGDPADVKLTALRDFDSQDRRPIRSDKLTLDCLHEGLRLYVERRA